MLQMEAQTLGGFSADLRSQCFHVACRGILLRSTGAKQAIRTHCQCQDFDFDYMENRTVVQHKAVEQRFLHFIILAQVTVQSPFRCFPQIRI